MKSTMQEAFNEFKERYPDHPQPFLTESGEVAFKDKDGKLSFKSILFELLLFILSKYGVSIGSGLKIMLKK